MRARAVAGVLLWLGVAVQGCAGECDEGLLDEATEFVNEHSSCSTDDDCAVGHTGCSELPGSFCGQIALNREAAESEKWKTFQRELGECGDSECAQCLAALVPTCMNGSCQRPQ